MSKKKKSTSTASKALALGTALSLGTFGFTAIGTGAAFGAPTANTATASLNTTKVIKLANGQTRIRLDLADNLRGKTVFIRTSRMVDGKRVVVTLGRVTLNRTGQAVLTVSRKIRVDDRLVVTDGIRNIVNSKITVIDDRTPVVPVPTPTPTPAPAPAPAPPSSPTVDSTAPTVSGPATISVAETETAVATYTANETVATWSLSGTNAALFDISTGGVVTFKTASTVGSYSIIVEATDAAGNKGTRSATISVVSAAEAAAADVVAMPLTDRAEVDAADAAYTALSADAQGFVTAAELLVITDAKTASDAAADVVAMPLTDPTEGDDARAAYDALTPEAKAFVTVAELADIDAARSV